MLGTVGIGCSVGIAVPCVLFLESLSVGPIFPSLPGAVGSGCSPVFDAVVLSPLTVDSRSPPLLETVGIDFSVGIGVPWVLVLESLSVASTFPSLPGVVGPGCSLDVGKGFPDGLVLNSFSVALEFSPLLETVG